MWTRVVLKSRAKKVLKNTYFISLIVGLVLLLLNSGRVTFNYSGNSSNYNQPNPYIQELPSGSFIEEAPRYVQPANPIIVFISRLFSITFALVMVIWSIFKIIVGNNLTVGAYRYFVRTGEGKEDSLSSLAYGFTYGRFSNIFFTMLLRSVYLFLWSLLFVFPGIVKSYSYRLVPHLLADNPNLPPKRAIYLSRMLMNGEKFSVFVLDLSFFGWQFLASIIPFVGQIALNPYLMATDAQLYIALREKGLRTGIITPEDVNYNIDPPIALEYGPIEYTQQ